MQHLAFLFAEIDDELERLWCPRYLSDEQSGKGSC